MCTSLVDGREGGILKLGLVWEHPGEHSSGSSVSCRAISTQCSAFCEDRCFLTHY